MSHTNDLILSELRGIGSTPSKSNQNYESDVQGWLWSYLGDLGIWNHNPFCHCHNSWVEQTAFSFQKYAKDIWGKSNSSYVNVKSKNKVWLDTPVIFPDVVECACMDESGIADVEVIIQCFLIVQYCY